MKSLANNDPLICPSIPGYTILEPLYTSSRTLVYRALQDLEQRPVVIKVMRQVYPSFSELVQFRHQYAITKTIDSSGIIRSLKLDNYQNGYFLVMEDCQSISLRDYCHQQRLTLNKVLEIAIQIAEILQHLHQNSIIHKDIKPANILIHPETQQVKLIDFSIASLLPKETQEIQNPNILEGTLSYLAPEQTGRMNRGIDYRADFYSLGVTLYELLTGQLPFVSEDPLELVHCHLAKIPVSPHEIHPNIPPIVSKIVLKLMAKNAEDRYQSARGISYDLQQCLKQWKETETILEFELGKQDRSDRFLIPEKLYGREKEVNTLLEAFDRVANGSAEMMLVAGFSGIGKTAVVNEVHKPITRQKGYFIKGKFDQFNRNIPFFAFVRALRDLMGQLLSESDSNLGQWRTKILQAVGDNGQVLIEVIPELESLIGKQPPAPELSETAAQNRFNLLFQKFLEVLTTKEHPLVIFLDDLQWSDSASLQLIKILMEERSYLLLLGAYRDNEVSPAHPFILTVDELKKTGKTVNTITLAPLAFEETNQLIADTLRCENKRARPLTELINRKTQGNPFFTTQFLKALYSDGYLSFNRDRGYWESDLAKINTLSLTDDVVEFMAQQLQKFPEETQFILQLAACIGNQFDLHTLAIVSQQSVSETSVILWKALREGLIIPQSEIYKFYLDSQEQDPHTKEWEITYRFLHDRVQQAAYSLIPEERKQEVHLNIGRLLLEKTLPELLDERIFTIVSQFNLGIEQIVSREERDNLANLNLIAGRKARLSAAYLAAYQYCEIGLKLLASENLEEWIRQPVLTLELYINGANSACLIGKFEQVDAYIKTALEQTTNPLDHVKILEIKIQSLIARNQLSEAITVAGEILQQLGVELPENPTPEMTTPALNKIRDQIGSKDVMNAPPMSDPKKLAAMNILSTQASAAYIGSPTLYPLIVLKQIELSLEFGNAIQTPYAYSTYGLILCAFGGEIIAGNQAADLAISLMETFKAFSFKAKIFNLVYPFVRIWQNPINSVLKPLIEGYEAGLGSGDLEFAAYCVYNYCQLAYAAGNELLQLQEEMKTYGDAISQLKQTTALNFHQIVQQAVLNWTSEVDEPQKLIGEVYDETTRLPQHQLAGDTYSIGSFYAHKLILAYHFGEPKEALEMMEISETKIGGIIGTVFSGVFYFYRALTLLANSPTLPISEKVNEDLERLKNWAIHAPMNFTHKCDLIQAEQQRILEEKTAAIELYDRAITGAKNNGFVQEQALANELAAKFYLNWGKEKIAAVYMQEAYYCYARWGAKTKVNDLEKRYPQLLISILQQPRVITSLKETITRGTISPTHSSTSISDALDLATLLKASQAISSEIEINKLLNILLEITLINAGGTKCVLLLKQESDLKIVALIEQGKSAQILPSIPLELSPDVPISLVNVAKRNEQPLVFIDASIDPLFSSDIYIQKNHPKSVICHPILHQGTLIGILYLENNLTLGAFTRERIEVLNLICSQAAISLENARLYQESQQALTELKQVQLKIIQSEKMSALGNLVAGVAHEINNPVGFLNGNIPLALDYINDLLGLIDLIQQKYPQLDPEVLEEIEVIELDYLREDLPKLIGSMREGVKRIQEISNSLRTFSRADSDHPIAFNIHDGIDSTIMILKHRLKSNDSRPEIKVIKEYGDLPKVQCYAGQLNQVFMNLLANAIDALDESNHGRNYGEITNIIRVKTEVLTHQKQVIIYIKDNGIGMKKEIQEKIFDNSFTTKGVGKGTGLGLAIARQIIVEKHGGILDVTSQEGEGTEFCIQLPL